MGISMMLLWNAGGLVIMLSEVFANVHACYPKLTNATVDIANISSEFFNGLKVPEEACVALACTTAYEFPSESLAGDITLAHYGSYSDSKSMHTLLLTCYGCSWFSVAINEDLASVQFSYQSINITFSSHNEQKTFHYEIHLAFNLSVGASTNISATADLYMSDTLYCQWKIFQTLHPSTMALLESEVSKSAFDAGDHIRINLRGSLLSSSRYWSVSVSVAVPASLTFMPHVQCNSSSNYSLRLGSESAMVLFDTINEKEIIWCTFNTIANSNFTPGANYTILTKFLYQDNELARDVIFLQALGVLMTVVTEDTVNELYAGQNLSISVTAWIPESDFHFLINISAENGYERFILSKVHGDDALLLLLLVGNRSQVLVTHDENLTMASYASVLFKSDYYFCLDFGKVWNPPSIIGTFKKLSFVLTFVVTSNALLASGKNGYIVFSAGASSTKLLFKIVGPVLHPSLVLHKSIKKLELHPDIVEVDVVVRHGLNSSGTAYSVSIEDKVQGLTAFSANVDVHGLAGVHPGDPFTQVIRATFGQLHVHENATLKYRAQAYLTPVNLVSLKASVQWTSGQDNSPLYGPVLSNAQCLHRHILYDKKYFPNHGYVALGVVLGILLGIIAPLLLLFCFKKFEVTRKYILHINDDLPHHIDPSLTRSATKPIYGELSVKKPCLLEESKLQPANLFRLLTVKRTAKSSEPEMIDISQCWKLFVVQQKHKEADLIIQSFHRQEVLLLMHLLTDAFLSCWVTLVKTLILKMQRSNDISAKSKEAALAKCDELYARHHKHPIVAPPTSDYSSSLNAVSTTFVAMYEDAMDIITRGFTNQDIKNAVASSANKQTRLESASAEIRDGFGSLVNKWICVMGTAFRHVVHSSMEDIVQGCLLLSLKEEQTVLIEWLKKITAKNVDQMIRKQGVSLETGTRFLIGVDEELTSLKEFLERSMLDLTKEEQWKHLREVKKDENAHFNSFALSMEQRYTAYSQKLHVLNEQFCDQDVDRIFNDCNAFVEAWAKLEARRKQDLQSIRRSSSNMLLDAFNVFHSRMDALVTELEVSPLPVLFIREDNSDDETGARVPKDECPDQKKHLQTVLHCIHSVIAEARHVISFESSDEEDALIRSCTEELFSVHDNMMDKFDSERRRIARLCKAQLKTHLYSFGILSWTDSEQLLKSWICLCFQSVIRRLLPLEHLPSNSFESLFTDERVNLEKINYLKCCFSDVIRDRKTFWHEKINDVCSKLKDEVFGIHANEFNDDSVRQLFKGHLEHAQQALTKLHVAQQQVLITSSFLSSQLVRLDREGLARQADVKRILDRLQKSTKLVLKESADDLPEEKAGVVKSGILLNLASFERQCSMICADEVDVDSVLVRITFDKDDLCERLFQMGRIGQYLEYRIQTMFRLQNENLFVIRDLLSENAISEEELASAVQKLSYILDAEQLRSSAATVFPDRDPNDCMPNLYRTLVGAHFDKPSAPPRKKEVVHGRRKRSKKNSVAPTSDE